MRFGGCNYNLIFIAVILCVKEARRILEAVDRAVKYASVSVGAALCGIADGLGTVVYFRIINVDLLK